jgi:hypothetical protein
VGDFEPVAAVGTNPLIERWWPIIKAAGIEAE